MIQSFWQFFLPYATNSMFLKMAVLLIGERFGLKWAQKKFELDSTKFCVSNMHDAIQFYFVFSWKSKNFP